MKMTKEQVSKVMEESQTFREYMANMYFNMKDSPTNNNYIYETTKVIVEECDNKISAIVRFKNKFMYQIEEVKKAFPNVPIECNQPNIGDPHPIRLSLISMKRIIETFGKY